MRRGKEWREEGVLVDPAAVFFLKGANWPPEKMAKIVDSQNNEKLNEVDIS